MQDALAARQDRLDFRSKAFPLSLLARDGSGDLHELCIAALYRVSGTNKPSGPLPTDTVGSSG
jgi:hypothetical protein